MNYIQNLSEGLERMLNEKTSEEDRANSERLRQITKAHYWGDEPWEEDELQFLDSMGLKVGDHNIVPKDAPNDLFDLRYNIDANAKWHAEDQKMDISHMAQKRYERDQAETSNKFHGQFRHSEKEKQLQKDLDQAKDYGSDRQIKNLSTRLKKEQDSLKDLRREYSPLSKERKEDASRMQEPINSFKRSKNFLSPEGEYERQNKAIDRDLQDVEDYYVRRVDDLNDRRSNLEQEKEKHQANIDRLLKRAPKTESLRQRRKASLYRKRINESLSANDFFKMEEGSYYTIIGTGGDLQEWKDGYQELLNKEGIGKIRHWITFKGSDINKIYNLKGDVAYPQDLTFLAFSLDGLNISKLSLFKLKMHDKWFDDIVENNKINMQELEYEQIR